MKISKKMLAITGGAVVVAGILGAFVLRAYLPVLRADAFTNDNEVRGYAWSSNIGWISFNCLDRLVCGSGPGKSDYRTTVDLSTGAMSGYAWSSNIGWIDVNPTAGYPAAPSHGMRLDMTTGTMTGWVRALSYGSGWDGWIKITNAKVGTGGYVLNTIDGKGGWAWGGDVVGWVQFHTGAFPFIVPHADCDFSASPATITLPEKSTLAWSCNSLTTVNSCAIDNGVGTKLPISGSRQAAPSKGTTYTLTCQGFGGPVIKAAVVSLTGETATGTIRIIETTPGQ